MCRPIDSVEQLYTVDIDDTCRRLIQHDELVIFNVGGRLDILFFCFVLFFYDVVFSFISFFPFETRKRSKIL